ncbi:GPO family capsid scaffolding protein [Novosphingobium huizhouense]|uniref:GPO family capsid scaffolding protein n=1 Tax=Novosphingobium huizhouense TaxID=2866625 RepID=UPI001CD8A652|nr:GPO family capsid scaffolding protein [Novosphingobium huizhouense]
MAKTRFFRVAVEGATTDGRAIERQWLLDAAQTYNRTTYAARVNLEHVRGVTADGPFQAYGDVLALKTEEIELDVAGKKEKRLALFAEIDALDPLVAMNKKGQKLYSSIEISPNFANSGKAYLVGLAVTDSPASLGTEMLQFAASQGENNPLAHRKQDKANLFTAATEATIELADETPAVNPDPTGIFASIKGLLDGFTGKPKESTPAGAPAAEPAATTPAVQPGPDAAAFTALGALIGQLTGVVENMSGQIATVAASTKATADKLAALESTIEATPHGTYRQRPAATGGEGNGVRTDC